MLISDRETFFGASEAVCTPAGHYYLQSGNGGIVYSFLSAAGTQLQYIFVLYSFHTGRIHTRKRFRHALPADPAGRQVDISINQHYFHLLFLARKNFQSIHLVRVIVLMSFTCLKDFIGRHSRTGDASSAHFQTRNH